MRLIIAEKPSAARDIAFVLRARAKGKGYIEGDDVVVTWCVGHVAELAEPSHYHPEWSTWSLEHLPMMPEHFELTPKSNLLDQWKVLRVLLHDARFTEVVNACDAGREGELIFRNVYEAAGAALPTRRLWLDDLTPEGVRKAFDALEDGAAYDALADAARCRSEADWLVGLNATRAMSLRANGRQVLSVGRVQTPTLAMLVDRERAIDAFEPDDFWRVHATFAADGTSFEAVYLRDAGADENAKRFHEQEAAQAVLEAVLQGPATVSLCDTRTTRQAPPALYDLTALQREMNKRAGLTAQQTLEAAQELYEAKLLTYPRTDSRHLPTTIRSTLDDRLAAQRKAPWAELVDDAGELDGRHINDGKVSDHHAIIPTAKAPDLEALDASAQALYEAVARRFLAAHYPPAVFDRVTLELTSSEHVLGAKGKALVEAGWHRVERPEKLRDADEVERLPALEEGRAVEPQDGRLHHGQTRPPDHFNENSLLGAMETAGGALDDGELRRVMKGGGLGTPATRANIIEKLIARDYVRRSGKHLLPTELGCELIDALPDPDLKSPRQTARWETALAMVEDGKLTRRDFMEKVRQRTRQLVARISAEPITLEALEPDTLGECPLCGEGVFAAKSVYTCRSGRDCEFVIWKTIAKKRITESVVKQLLAGKTTRKLKGFKSKKGNSFSARLTLDDNGRAQMQFDDGGK
jgi:DNA topoisomerase-3